MAQDCLGHPKLQATDATALLKTAFPHQNVANPSLQRSTNAGHQLLLTQRLDGTPSTTFNQGATWGGASGSFAVREGHTDCYHSGCVQCCMGSSLRAHPRLRALQLFFVWHQQARTIPPPLRPTRGQMLQEFHCMSRALKPFYHVSFSVTMGVLRWIMT